MCWLVEGWLAQRLLGSGGLLAFAVLLVPAGLLALGGRDRLSRAGRQARAFVRLCADRQLPERLRAERRGLVEELTALARRAPDAVLEGRLHER